MLSDLLRNIDAHYDKLVSSSSSFLDSTTGLLGFNNPKKHNHSHLKPLCKLVLDIFEKVTKYIEYLSAQKDKMRNTKNQKGQIQVPIDLYIIHKLKQFVRTNHNFSTPD